MKPNFRSRWLGLAAAGLLLTASGASAVAEDAPAEPPAPAEPAPKPAEPPAPAEPAAKPAEPAAKPAEAKASSAAGRRWSLDFSHGPLKRVLVDDGTGRETSHYYMTMTVGNSTGLARDWRPYITLKVDTRPEAYVAGGFANALDGIRRQEGERDLVAIDTTGWRKGDEGKLPAGARKNFVAIFGPLDPGWASARIEVNGLVNPITTLKVLKYGEKHVVLEAAYAARNQKVMDELKAAAKASGSDVPAATSEYWEVLERRVRSIEYHRDGDEFRPDDDLIQFVREGWDVIGEPKLVRPPIPASS